MGRPTMVAHVVITRLYDWTRTQNCVVFIIYVNDICDVIPIEVTVKLFADDTKIYSALSDDMSVECLQAYCTFVRPILEYASVVWSPYNKCDINK